MRNWRATWLPAAAEWPGGQSQVLGLGSGKGGRRLPANRARVSREGECAQTVCPGRMCRCVVRCVCLRCVCLRCVTAPLQAGPLSTSIQATPLSTRETCSPHSLPGPREGLVGGCIAQCTCLRAPPAAPFLVLAELLLTHRKAHLLVPWPPGRSPAGAPFVTRHLCVIVLTWLQALPLCQISTAMPGK